MIPLPQSKLNYSRYITAENSISTPLVREYKEKYRDKNNAVLPPLNHQLAWLAKQVEEVHIFYICKFQVIS